MKRSPLYVVALFVMASSFAQSQPGDLVDDGTTAMPEKLAKYTQPPKKLADDFGDYKSPLKFKDGSPVKTAKDWAKRRDEIRKEWHDLMGEWPPLLEEPKIKFLDKERKGKVTKHRMQIEIAPGRFTEDAYLLVPDGDGPFPAVVVVFYDGKTGIGEGKGKTLDYAWQLAQRGFVTLSVGSPPESYFPNNKSRLQPLSYHAYVAANLHRILARLDFVDASRVGIIGHSYGGKWALFASCLYDGFACAVWSDPGIVFDEKRGNVNYWERWYLGHEIGKERKPGIPSDKNPRTGPYKTLFEKGHDLHELHVMMAPRPFLVSAGSEDPVERWKALNHSRAVNKLLGFEDRVAMTNRPMHTPTVEDNEIVYLFFEHWLRKKVTSDK